MKTRYSFLLFFIGSLLITSCTPGSKNSMISFDKYKIADGFEIQLAASEPLIEAPVAMDFDNQGRMWVVEMRGYMPNLAGTGEDEPNGRISILGIWIKMEEHSMLKYFWIAWCFPGLLPLFMAACCMRHLPICGLWK